jgi:hypothetical protein
MLSPTEITGFGSDRLYADYRKTLVFIPQLLGESDCEILLDLARSVVLPTPVGPKTNTREF